MNSLFFVYSGNIANEKITKLPTVFCHDCAPIFLIYIEIMDLLSLQDKPSVFSLIKMNILLVSQTKLKCFINQIPLNYEKNYNSY